MPWLFSTTTAAGTGGTAAATGATPAAAAPVAAGGIGAGLTTVGGTGTFGGLGVGGAGVPLSGVAAGTPGLGVAGLGTMPAYGAGTFSAALGGASPSLLYGAGGALAPTTGLFSSTPGIQPGQGPASYIAQNVFNPQMNTAQRVAGAVLKPGGQDIIDGLLTGLTLSDPPAGPAGGGDRGVQPQPLPNQVQAMPSGQNRGRMGFNANGILSWLPQTPQVPQVPQIPGQLPPLGPYRG